MPTIVPPDADGPSRDPAAVGPGAPGDQVDPDVRRRRRRRWIGAGALLGSLALVVTALALWQIPYYRFAPGGLYPTGQLIAVQGAPSYRDAGEIEFTTVSMKPATALDAVLGWRDPAVLLIDKDKIDGGRQPEENRQENLEMMATSKEVAEFVALRTLGYKVEVLGTGALVRSVEKGAPAADALSPGDAVVAVDDAPVRTSQELIDVLARHRPGDVVGLGVEARPGDRRDVEVTLGARPDDASRPYLGVGLGTRDARFQAPFSVAIDSRDVGGPSAGLAFTLGVIDALTPGSLTGGRRVATTGTIDAAGNVGEVGGVTQKAIGARRDGVELFLVPPAEYEEAAAVAGSMKVVPVSDVHEALRIIADNGGDTRPVTELASANGAPDPLG